MRGQIYKIHSDFYYVKTQQGTFECKLREILKKQKQEVVVGDFVKLEQVNQSSMQAFISCVLDRVNFIPRPKSANITQAIIVSALKEPDLDFEQLNRYIAHCEFHNIKPVLCFNKDDLVEGEHILLDKIEQIYKPLEYKIVFTSALKESGITDLLPLLKNNVSIFCGSSGVGKSSIINILADMNIKTKNVSDKTKRGVHTTRHCEIISIDDSSAVVDTPGFSSLKFNFLMPTEIQFLFKEIFQNAKSCKFSNCLHINESDCSVLSNLEKIDETRYSSYVKFVKEAIEFKNKITYEGKKIESKTKQNQNKVMTKISYKKRISSRKLENQNLAKDDNDET